MTAAADSNDNQVYLPDFCAAGTLLIVILIAELVAIVLTLAAYSVPGTFLTELSKMSMYILLLSLPGAALLCRLTPWLSRFEPVTAFSIAFVILESLCLAIAELTWQLTSRSGSSVVIDDTHAGFVLRTAAISCIVLALTMRYLYVGSEWRRSIVLEAQSRISALQALIRPHFLFNSMNTIASLTRSNPRQAEEAVEDLADLMRANLGAQQDRTPLKQEFELAAIYQRIEKLRLGDRLRVRWDVAELPMRALIPSLTIQPLLENAIYHGIESLPEGGEVVVSGRRDGDNLRITVSNPVSKSARAQRQGNRMAMSNIRQRYDLAYDGRALVDIDESDGKFCVTLLFPCEERAA